MNLKIKTAIKGAWSYSKWILSAIAIIVAVKFLINPGTDTSDVIAWRLLQIALVLPPIVFIGMFFYCYFGLDKKDKE
jgi:hypothetical protein